MLCWLPWFSFFVCFYAFLNFATMIIFNPCRETLIPFTTKQLCLPTSTQPDGESLGNPINDNTSFSLLAPDWPGTNINMSGDSICDRTTAFVCLFVFCNASIYNKLRKHGKQIVRIQPACPRSFLNIPFVEPEVYFLVLRLHCTFK